MELIKLKKPLIHTIPLKRRIFLDIKSYPDINYSLYLEKIDMIRFSELNFKSKIILIMQFLLSGFICLIFSFSIVYALPDLIELLSFDISLFFTQISEIPNLFEKMLTKVVVASLVALVYLVVVFIFLIIYKSFKFCLMSMIKPLRLTKEEKSILDRLQGHEQKSELNPQVTSEKRYFWIFAKFEFNFNFVNPELNLEDYILSIKHPLSLIGINFVIGSWIFLFIGISFLFNPDPDDDLFISLLMTLGFALASVLFTYSEIYLPSLTFKHYYNVKHQCTSYLNNRIQKAYNMLLNDNTNIPEALNIIILKEIRNDFDKLPIVPTSRIIKMWTLLALIIPLLSLLIQ